MGFSRQEKLRAMFDAFASGTPSIGNKKLILHMYPPELKRFQEEYSELNFTVTNTKKTASSKKHEVVITRK